MKRRTLLLFALATAVSCVGQVETSEPALPDAAPAENPAEQGSPESDAPPGKPESTNASEETSPAEQEPTPSFCGDGKIDDHETCDGDCPRVCEDGDPCTRSTLEGSAAACDARCLHTPIANLWCSGFENEEALEYLARRGGEAVRSHLRSHSGTHSLRFTAPATAGAWAFARITDGFPLEHFFGRAWLFFAPPVNNGHTHFLRAYGPDPNDRDRTAAYRLDGVGYSLDPEDATQIQGRFESRASSDATHGGVRTGARRAVLAQWHCLEWEFDGENDSARYWVDGEHWEELDTVGATGGLLWHAPDPFRGIEIGIRQYHENGGTDSELFVDDLALSTSRVGCE